MKENKKEIFYKAKVRYDIETVVAQKVIDKTGKSYIILIDSAILTTDHNLPVSSVPERDYNINTVKDLQKSLSQQFFDRTTLSREDLQFIHS